MATVIRPKHQTANKSGYSNQTQTPNCQQVWLQQSDPNTKLPTRWLQQSDSNTKLPTSLATAIRPKYQTANKSGYSNQTQIPNSQQVWLQQSDPNIKLPTSLATAIRPKHQTPNKTATAIRPKHQTTKKSGYSNQTQTPNSQQDGYSNQTQTPNYQQVWLQQSDPNTKLPTSLATAIRPKYQTAIKPGYSNQTQIPNCQQVWLQKSDPNTKLLRSLTCGRATTGGQWVSRVQVGCELLHAEHLADVARVHI